MTNGTQDKTQAPAPSAPVSEPTKLEDRIMASLGRGKSSIDSLTAWGRNIGITMGMTNDAFEGLYGGHFARAAKSKTPSEVMKMLQPTMQQLEQGSLYVAGKSLAGVKDPTVLDDTFEETLSKYVRAAMKYMKFDE